MNLTDNTVIDSPAELALALVEHPYSWPGGYPLFAVTDDGGALCKGCCATEHDAIDSATEGDGWFIVALYVNWEAHNEVVCDHCGELIEAAYGD